METEYINKNDEPRFITKLEKESLLDWWVEEYADQYSLLEQETFFNKWVENMNWSEIDFILNHYK